jgi:arsenate reductase
MNEQAVITPGERSALHNVARDLHHKFEGVFGIETIEALVLDSFDELARMATVTRWRVVSAERFAEQRLKALMHAEDHSAKVPGVLFLCVHNAGRSQMALGWFSQRAGSRAIAWSGGSEPGAEINEMVVAAMAEVGIDISQEFPKPWTDEFFGAADVVVTMGCGDACPLMPGKHYEDWELEDPTGKSLEEIRPIRDEIRDRVDALLVELLASPLHDGGR